MTSRTLTLALALLATATPASALDLSFLDRIPKWAWSMEQTYSQPLPAKPWPVDIPADVRPSKRLPEDARRVLPPIEYERPYLGNLSLTRTTIDGIIKLNCDKSKLNLACARRGWPEPDGTYKNCHIHMANDQQIMAAGYSPQVVYRHELAHCNGWPGDHPNSRVAP